MCILESAQKNMPHKNTKFLKRIQEIIYKRKMPSHCELSSKLYQEFDNGLFERKKKNNILKGSIFIYNIKIIRDELRLFKPVYTVHYKDLIFNEYDVIENVTFDELTSELYDKRLFIDEIPQVRRIINEIINESHNKEYENVRFITTETKVFKEGFFLKDGKVIENTLITGFEPTKEQIQESIRLINELLKNRGSAIANDCTVLRFMLWSPFSWCLKEISKSKAVYGLILTGKKQTNKTGSCYNFSWLYSIPKEREQAVNTTSVFGSRLEESTLPAIIDESYDLISREDMQDPMKRCIYNKDTRSTKDKTNSQLTINYKALGLPIFTLNEYGEFKSFITRRYHINNYTSSMIVSNKDAEEFEKKYLPESENSPLKTLRYLGRAFADKFIPYVESNSEELFDLEKLTVKLLKEIADEVGEEFIPSVYEIQESVDNFDQDICATIRNGLNKLFISSHKKAIDRTYIKGDFISCAKQGEINWLFYRNKDEKFVINKKGFEKEVSQIVGENMDCESILKELDIDIKDKNFNEVIATTRNNTRGFKISSEYLIINIFDMYVDGLPNPEDTYNEKD